MFDQETFAGVSTGSEFVAIPDQRQVLPPLMNAYHEHGYEVGYARGRSDVLAAILEVTEDFARRDPASAAKTRRLLYAFSEVIEQRIHRGPRPSQSGFIDGSGI
jgi:hypothetical protein